MQYPMFLSKRLTIRPFELDDAPRVQELAGDKEVAKTTTIIPPPYPDGWAEEWITSTHTAMDKGDSFHFAMVNEQNMLIGCIYLFINKKHNKGELGYWLGKSYWGKGYCTEVGQVIVTYAFEELQLNRIYADAFTKNPASSKVMQKLGLKHEGTFKQSCLYWGVYEDTVVYGLTRSDYNKSK
ncbi:GNAT family N-acetyltransferase [Bacillus pseudomycoides]|uniref:GNAT family N-acetyltransferase n=1 Tax=Bacillus pseudomycoides TaxID=64104 RepID=UPI000BFC2C48|nr:GNAT family N-acetyltransferase [Bacillus pseudomycoides]PHB24531.1 GNAT family N-acetyltransferase [Bacillus pseudomycoides]